MFDKKKSRNTCHIRTPYVSLILLQLQQCTNPYGTCILHHVFMKNNFVVITVFTKIIVETFTKLTDTYTCIYHIIIMSLSFIDYDQESLYHYCDAIMKAMALQITSLAIVYSTVHSSADQRKHQRSVSLAFVRVIHQWPVNSPHKWPVTRKIFLFDDVIMIFVNWQLARLPWETRWRGTWSGWRFTLELKPHCGDFVL